ncbi:excalibur calcium-binding domain-containing protein [Methylibium sp.]|uniref:excalibur calcium-binding domain-containing protein n=1 Tax=Methylibium sp. TaxID=2067992 RepID=UPI0017B9F6F3|nr:excalibur calcium-binding domain-containing protein [Methylibium sp.]MBA3588966.1 excalibur calcium-binding domain-containing protein [Methylibium sp.]
MIRLAILLILVAVCWQGYTKYQSAHAQGDVQTGGSTGASIDGPEPAASPTFKCDGRTHCSQMTSCAEATFFLKSCPGVKMDGNNDGVPCEQQWCN